jgi:hypothetical protein
MAKIGCLFAHGTKMVGRRAVEQHKRIVALNERLREQESYVERVFVAISDLAEDYDEQIKRRAISSAQRVLDKIKGDDRTAQALLSLVTLIRGGELFRVRRLVKEEAAERARTGRYDLVGMCALRIAIRTVIEGTEEQPAKHPSKHRRSLAYAELIRNDVVAEVKALMAKDPMQPPVPVPPPATLKKRIVEVLDEIEAQGGESLIPEA